MSVTRLKRKLARRRSKSARRKLSIKLLTTIPILKNVDVEAIKAEFIAAKAKL